MPGFDQPGSGPDPDLTETAVMPHVEGPPLVRPYAPAAPAGARFAAPGQQQPVPPMPPQAPGPYQAPPVPYQLPSGQPPQAPPVPPQAPPVPPQAPPVPTAAQPMYGQVPPMPVGAPRHPQPPAAPPVPAAPPAAETTMLLPPAPPSAAPRELGLFPLATDEPRSRRAARRSGQRRTGLVAAAGAGVVLLGVGLAFALSPGADGNRTALPVQPTGVQDPSPSDQPSASDAPSAAAQTGSAAPTSAKPTVAPKSKAPAPAPTTAAPPTSQAPKPTPSASPTPSPTPTGPPQTLRLGYSGPELAALQQQLIAAGCAGSLDPAQYDWDTAMAVSNFQQANHSLRKEEWGAYTPATRAALTSGKTC
ncbi:peptidoglycan-binding protein [Kitasatospora sp. NPDC058965]|uniref:peptidoglycan-binding domain-containing protein n=1 Tax=Kitasatospora sp. NPDC058965 TaxID=3346682 RepID=UPI00369BFE89